MKLNYEEFKEQIVLETQRYLPEGTEVTIQPVDKVNGPIEAIQIQEPGRNYALSMNIENIYDDKYLEGESIESIAASIAHNAMEAERPPQIPELNRDFILNDIIPVVVNTEANKAILSKCPHRELESTDLSIMARIELAEGATTNLTKDIARQCYMTDSEIMDAVVAKAQSMAFSCKNIAEVLFGFSPAEMSAEMSPMFDSPIYVLTTESGFMGASVLANKDALDCARDVVGKGEDVYILPSSIHETLVIPQSVCTKEQLADMVASVNETEVSAQDFLSNQVYTYDGKRLELADKQVLEKTETKSQERRIVF